ncbi:hypothetical protein PCANC_06127 [Puccinia coronata f. sp. avenae]|uniref:Uncharacterized protein n=1 Tax=Puccinia coronata f. sp. avenae TaxID=200324 RepID=A0A2N5VTX8_9BASI|nr:hypothetical protein PCANC_06127 [Puccinia coronata f. sp. avenae]
MVQQYPRKDIAGTLISVQQYPHKDTHRESLALCLVFQNCIRASPTVLLLRRPEPTLAARYTFLPSSGAVMRAAKGSGGGSELPSPATLGSLGSHLPKLPHPLFGRRTVEFCHLINTSGHQSHTNSTDKNRP